MSASHPQSGARLLAMALSLLLTMSGCAQLSNTKGVEQQTVVNYYPKCYQPVSELRQADQQTKEKVAGSAITGALVGAAAGGIATGGKATGVVLGAVAGALAGAYMGYYMDMKKQYADDRARMHAYGADIDRTTGQYNRTTTAARAAQRCYQQEYRKLVQARKSKKMQDDEGRRRFTEIVSGMSEANALLAAVDGRIGENLDVYAKAYREDAGSLGQNRAQASSTSSTPSTQAANRRLRSAPNRNTPPEVAAVDRKVQTATAAREEIKTVSTSIAADIRNFCSSPDIGDWGSESACKKSA